MHQHPKTSPSTRPRQRSKIALAVAAFLLLSSCGSSAEPEVETGSDGTIATAGADQASQPLESVVIDATALVDGAGGTHLVDLAIWVAGYRKEKCGGPGSLMAEGERFDQALFPDFDLIAREGLGGGPETEPEPEVKPADEGCLASTLPELFEADKVFSEWMEAVVYPTWERGDVVRSASRSATCLTETMGWDDPDVSLDNFLAMVTGVATQWSDLSWEEQSPRLAELDREASAALATCAKDTYEMFSSLLEEQRGPFLERHDETIAAAARALDEAGYAP